MKKQVLAGVILSQSRKMRPEMKSVLTWLNIKIDEFMMRAECNEKFINTNRALIEFSEIMGALKLLHMGNFITVDEFKTIITIITQDDVSGDDAVSKGV